jgi:hypothetical protein
MTSTGTNIARRLWDQRQQMRGEYEDIHGTDRALWPVQHPGVVLGAVPSTAVVFDDFCYVRHKSLLGGFQTEVAILKTSVAQGDSGWRQERPSRNPY